MLQISGIDEFLKINSERGSEHSVERAYDGLHDSRWIKYFCNYFYIRKEIIFFRKVWIIMLSSTTKNVTRSIMTYWVNTFSTCYRTQKNINTVRYRTPPFSCEREQSKRKLDGHDIQYWTKQYGDQLRNLINFLDRKQYYTVQYRTVHTIFISFFPMISFSKIFYCTYVRKDIVSFVRRKCNDNFVPLPYSTPFMWLLRWK